MRSKRYRISESSSYLRKIDKSLIPPGMSANVYKSSPPGRKTACSNLRARFDLPGASVMIVAVISAIVGT
jgi:hypothetical protein